MRPRRSGLIALAMLLACAGGCRRTKRLVRGGDAAAVVVIEPPTSDPAELALPSEQEPNDTPAAPQVLPFGGDPPAAGVAGTLAAKGTPTRSSKRPTGDVDLFAVTIPGGSVDASAAPDAGPVEQRRLAVEVRPDPGSSVAVQVLGPTGEAIASAVATGGRDGVPNVTVNLGATYQVRVRLSDPRRANPDGGVPGYRLAVRVLPFETGDEREPNGSAAQANDLPGAEKGAEAAGFVGLRRDEDWYRVGFQALGAPASVTAEVDAVEDVALSLAVHDATGARLGLAKGRRGGRVAVESLSIPAAAGTTAGSCFVVVRAEAGRNLDQRYVLRVRAEVSDEVPPAGADR